MYALLSDPNIGFGLAIVLATLGSIKGVVPWKYTGILYVFGGVFYYLSSVFGPQAAASIIVSNIIGYLFGTLKTELKYRTMRAIDNTFSEQKS